MECKACGRTSQNENANFCDYCGTSLKERGQVTEPNPVEEMKPPESPIYQSNMQNQGQFYQSNTQNQGQSPWGREAAYPPPEEKPIPFWIFFGVMAVGLIPGIGLLIQIAVLAVFAFGQKATKVGKNWARAFLLFNLLSFVVTSYLLLPMLDGLLGNLK